MVHQVPKATVGSERRIEVKFNDDADDNGRTPARSLLARYVVPLPEGFEEEETKVEEEEPVEGVSERGGGAGGAGEDEEADDQMGEFFFCVCVCVCTLSSRAVIVSSRRRKT